MAGLWRCFNPFKPHYIYIFHYFPLRSYVFLVVFDLYNFHHLPQWPLEPRARFPPLRPIPLVDPGASPGNLKISDMIRSHDYNWDIWHDSKSWLFDINDDQHYHLMIISSFMFYNADVARTLSVNRQFQHTRIIQQPSAPIFITCEIPSGAHLVVQSTHKFQKVILQCVLLLSCGNIWQTVTHITSTQ